MNQNTLMRIKDAINAYKSGQMLIVMDDEDRENEGDLVLAGIFATPDKINFMAKFARGLICTAITSDLAKTLDLPPMVQDNDSNHHTAFTISIDAKEAKTGISAFERAMTIELMCKDNPSPSDFVRPGHIFPLVAKDGGVLVRTGHTEAGVDLCLLAGLKPVSVICEIMKDDGSMARRGDKFISDFAKEHDIKILYISDLVAYRIEHDNLLDLINQSQISFLSHSCTKIEFQDHLKRSHFALKFGEAKRPFVKFQFMRNNFEFLCDEPKFDFFYLSLQKIAKEGGFIIFLDDKSAPGDIVKNIGIGSGILKSLGVHNFTLLSNSKRVYNALGGFGLEICKTINLSELKGQI
ncbi:MAG: bifunctional 3,4-dihydroxy-2-butanone 4-phosphate synthase/GTP cyclohydrolase II [Helicobacter sp.]|nr:bifunctional 3,4-dihydroxy-2-butanone 4-phosphate synthase/GTP cyclohydrolase II [Helicobacter sp.]